ncbi:hypothetical protein QRX60_25120 [Amycolatopsis mongoliensis]|uniref:Uncharacterized protein n=1 Tax=Amycolatopsis mongoliensis TaxID=715475 RepID=A0A9Y2NQR9_9PSEU|nr:hypothetical protein [Amycolatopsis sp. 4-36]WIY06975.1 hypothetical protein QRX60_25120 [Amycolatopsis sp. 4-36]
MTLPLGRLGLLFGCAPAFCSIAVVRVALAACCALLVLGAATPRRRTP